VQFLKIKIPEGVRVNNVTGNLMDWKQTDTLIQVELKPQTKGSDNKTKKDTGCFFQIGFGNCACRSESFDIQVRGCPPYPFTLKEVLDDK